jgi:cadmium resistance protein CadD (predicted permease)
MTASLLVTAVLAFMGSTVDDVIILTTLFMAHRTVGRPRTSTIIAGQYAGFAAIIGTSLVAATGLQVVPGHWVRLLGLVPIAFGLWGLSRLRHTGSNSRPPLASTAPRIAAITFANGADSISLFTPLFRTLHTAGSLLTTALFLLLVGAWCALGATLGSRQAAVTTLGRISHWLIPLVFIAVGALILF